MAKQSSGGSSFESKSSLNTGAERFLSQAVEHAFEDDFRTPEEFLRQFTPHDLMLGLEGAPELRGQILSKAVGFHERIARKKSTESAAEDLRIALEEGVTSAADIVNSIEPDDRVRYLDSTKLFAFAVDEKFFSGSKSGVERDRAIDRMVFLLETAIGEGLTELADVTDGVTFEAIAQYLPVVELQRLVEGALRLGRNGGALTDQRLIEIVSLRTLVSHIPLDVFWTRVLVEKVARPARFLSDAGAGSPSVRQPDVAREVARVPEPTRAPEPARATEVARAAPPKAAPPKTTPPREVVKEPPPKPARAPVNGKPKSEEGRVAPPAARNPEPQTESPMPSAESVATSEDDAPRRRVIERLSAIQRLPPRHSELPTGILFEIDSMYAELNTTTNEEIRAEIVRDSFPNEQHMSVALLALIELLEPSIDLEDPESADVEALLNVFLIEERQHQGRAAGSQRSVPAGNPAIASPPPPPPPPPTPPPPKRTVPPPLPRAASANPMPPPLPGLEKSR